MWGADAYLLAQHIDGCLAYENSLQMETSVHLATIPFVDEAFWDFGTFGLVALHLFSAGMRHLLAVVDLICLIEMLKELHTKMQGMI